MLLTVTEMTQKMTKAQVVETSVTINNSPFQDYAHPDDHSPSTFEMTFGFNPCTVLQLETRIQFYAHGLPESQDF